MEKKEKGKELMYLRPPFVELVQQTHPWLLITHGSDFQRHTFYSVSEDRYYTRTIPELLHKRTWASFYGWLLMDDYKTDEYCLFNPITLEKIKVPSIEGHARCILSKPPTDPDCHILFMSDRLLFFCKLGEDKFAEQSNNFGNDRIAATTTCGGKIYGLMIPSRIIVIVRFVDSTIQVEPLIDKKGKPLQIPRPAKLKERFYHDFLIESDNELLLLLRFSSEFNVLDFSEFIVFRVDTSEMTYQEITNMGERTIFLGFLDAIAYSTTDLKVKKNCVYFVKPEDRNLYVYDLEERSKTILLPCPIVDRINAYKCWVMTPYIV